MAKGNASALATANGFLTARVKTSRSASTLPEQWLIVKSWYALSSETNRSGPTVD